MATEQVVFIVADPAASRTPRRSFGVGALIGLASLLILGCLLAVPSGPSYDTLNADDDDNFSGTVTATKLTDPVGAPHGVDHPTISHSVSAPIEVPEFVNRSLLDKFIALQAGFAKQMRVPFENRNHMVKTWGNQAGGYAVLIGGELEMRDGSDTEILFRQESNFIYVTGFDHPGARAIIGLDENGELLGAGECWLFVPRGNAVWDGRTETLKDFEDAYDITNAFWIEDFENKLDELMPTSVFTFSGVNIPIPDSAEHDTTALRASMATSRAVKTPGEIEMLRAASEITVEAHLALMRNIRCGNYESEAESLFRYVSHNYGARFQAYIPIVGGGQNSAALHYNDNDNVIPQDGLVLVDAGAEIGGTRNGGGWTSDVTRTFPCSGKYTAEQKAIYDIVFKAQDKCREMCVPGESMANATSAVNRILVEGLLESGILKGGSVDELMSARIYNTFMPHGLGHSVGLDVHDPGSIAPFRAGMVVTCEPGIYFIESLLDAALGNPSLSRFLDRGVLSRYDDMGGIRLEDTILITVTTPENLSRGAPRTSEEIEAVMAAALNTHDHVSMPTSSAQPLSSGLTIGKEVE